MCSQAVLWIDKAWVISRSLFWIPSDVWLFLVFTYGKQESQFISISAGNNLVGYERMCVSAQVVFLHNVPLYESKRRVEDSAGGHRHASPGVYRTEPTRRIFTVIRNKSFFERSLRKKKKKKRCHVYWLIRYQSGKRVMKAATSATIQHQCQEAGARENARQTAEMNCRGLNVECDQC